MECNLIFIYDELLKKSEQELLSLGLRFLFFGTVKAKLYFLNDDKKKRLFIIPNKGKSTKVTYGALYEILDYDEAKYKLFAYYNSSMLYVGSPLKEDLYMPVELEVTPIKFRSLKQLGLGTYKQYHRKIKATVFVGNPQNTIIEHNVKRRKYYGVNSVNSQGFVQCIKDNLKTETEVKHNGLE